MATVTAGSPDVSTVTLQSNGEYSPSPSPSSAESNFRELDDAFLQTQTRIWLGEVLHIRFDDDLNISDILADGELLFEMSEALSRMLPTSSTEAPHLRVNERKSIASNKSTKRYMPYYNVGSFLRVCKNLGLNGIDLFSPSDVVEKRNTRKVCMCIRSLSKKVRSRDLSVPDFDSVTCTLTMPTDMVEGIRKSLELSQSSSSISVGHESEKISRIRYWKRMSSSEVVVSNGYSSDHCDDADSSFIASEFNGASASPNTPGSEMFGDCSIPSLELQLGSEHENEEDVQCEYLSPTISESVGSLSSRYYSDQELDNITASTSHGSHRSDMNHGAIYECLTGDVNHVPIDWGCISSDDGYRDCDAYNDEINLLSHDEDDSDASCNSYSVPMENETCNDHFENWPSLGDEREKDSCTPMTLILCGNSLLVGGKDSDVHDGCAVQDCCDGETPLAKFVSLDTEPVDIVAAKHELVTCELSPDIYEFYSNNLLNGNDLLNESVQINHDVCNLTEVPKCSLSYDENCASQLSSTALNVGDFPDNTTSVDVADMYHSQRKTDHEAFDVDTVISGHAEGCRDSDFMVDDTRNPTRMPDMVTPNDGIKCSGLDGDDTREKPEDHVALDGRIISKSVNAEGTRSMKSFTTILQDPGPETERLDNVEDTGLKHHPHAENIKIKSEDNGTDKEIPKIKPQRTLLKSLVKGTALVGFAVILLHLRKNGGAQVSALKDQLFEVRKRNRPKPSTQKGGNSSGVYPPEKLNLGI